LFGLRKRRTQRPDAVFLNDRLTVSEIANQVGHEQRMAFGATVYSGSKVVWKAVLGKLQREITVDVLLSKAGKLDLSDLVPRLEVELHSIERVSCKLQFRFAVSGNDEKPEAVKLSGQVRNRIDRGVVGPLKVIVEKER